MSPVSLRWRLGWVVPLGLGLLMGMAGELGQPSIAQANPRSAPVLNTNHQLPPSVRSRILAVAARDLGQAPGNLTIREATRVTWPDSCLGLGGPAELCAQMQVPGWAVEVSERQSWGPPSWFYRADQAGQIIRQAVGSRSLTPEVEQRLLRQAERSLKLPSRSLTVTALKRRTWDGCMGVYDTPLTACTMIAIDGWQAILNQGDRAFVFHLDRAANLVRYNPAASNGTTAIVPMTSDLPALGNGERFQVHITGGIAGRQERWILMEDGRVLRRINNQAPEWVGQLSASQRTELEQALDNGMLSNLSGLSYLPTPGAADYQTVTLIDRGVSVQYADLMRDRLPQSIQQVTGAWERAIARLQTP